MRSPERCILSQIRSEPPGLSWLGKRRYQRRLKRPNHVAQKTLIELEKWLSLVDHFIASDLPKLAITFEALTSDGRLDVVNERLLPFFDIDHRFKDLAELDHVGEFARESQTRDVKSRPEGFYDRHTRAKEKIRNAVNYDEECQRVGTVT